MQRVRVWDPWIRLVHWAIVLLIPLSYWTASTERWAWHYRAGYVLLTLVLFRIAWGFLGSDTARFARFLKSPLAALRHLGEIRRPPAHAEIGHNAAGGWMVLLMLALLLAQPVSGLFANHDPGMSYSQHGPLSLMVSEAASELATRIHLRVFWIIVAAAVLHVAAIMLYRVLRQQNLVRPMVTGVLEVPAEQTVERPRLGHPVLALALLAGAAAFVWWVTSLAPARLF